MKKLFIVLLIFITMSITCEAKNIRKDIASIIKDSNISQNSIAISIKELKSGHSVYKLNDQILMHPASVQKILTLVPIMEVLGKNYNFSTKIYEKNKSEYLIQLGADPYLKTSDLKVLVDKINPAQVHKIYIDDSIIERKDWGEGWQWDDGLNLSMPKFNSYNLDGNIISFTVMPTEQKKQSQIINTSKYPIVFLNNVITDKENNISIKRETSTAANIIRLDGTVVSPVVEKIPNNNLKLYFNIKLKNVLEDNKIYLKEPFGVAKTNSANRQLAEITHPVSVAVDDVLQNSNNMVIETMAKIAGGKYYNRQGTDADAINLFNQYFEKNGIDNSRIRLTDASGVSKNNLVNADFITEFLVKNQDNIYLKKMATPGYGTLANRMIPLKNNLRAKTGTLSDISSIAGFLTTKNGTEYAFSILINDPSSTSSEKKILENYIIRDIYLKY